MKIFNLIRYAFGIAAGIALLAGCGANGTAPSLSSSVAPQSVTRGHHTIQELNKMFAMTNVAHQGVPAERQPLAKSWHIKPPPGTTGTIWATDDEYASVDEVAYPSGTLVGQVGGFSYPYGDCTDKAGNVYVADFDLEEIIEISGGSVVNSWPTGGESIGCSVSNTGDVAASTFYPGGVVIVAGPDAGASYSGPGYDWPAGYDKNGNLFVTCNYYSPCSSPHLAELPAGSNSWIFLNLNKALNFPGAVQWTHKWLGVADQSVNNATGIDLVKISGSNATVVKTIILEGGSCSPYMDVSSSWAAIGKKPNGVGSQKVKGFAAGNLWCFPSPLYTYGKKGGSPTNQWLYLSSQYVYGTTFTKP